MFYKVFQTYCGSVIYSSNPDQGLRLMEKYKIHLPKDESIDRILTLKGNAHQQMGNYQEARIRHFHKTLDDYLAA